MSKAGRISIISLFVSLMAVSAWIQIPAPIPVTLQTLGVYLACGVLGGGGALISTAIYILLGTIGLPLFSGFSGGVGMLFGATGGFIVGFLFIPLALWIFEKTKFKAQALIFGTALGTIVCYFIGAAWYSLIYMKGSVGFLAAIITCVLPYIIPDAIKLTVAIIVSNRINMLKKGF